MKNCFGYIRVSTVKQGDGVSLQAQKNAILDYAKQHNIHIEKWFEETITAAKVGRPMFNKMVSELKKGCADGLVVHKIDRSSRNYFDWASINELADAGVEIHATTDNLDFCSRGGRLAADIQMVFATDYIRNLKEEVRKGQQEQLKQGLYPWGAPLGYVNHGEAALKTPDPAKAPFIVKAFELYASGEYSLRSLQIEMKELGLRSKTGRIVSRSSLENILANPFYCGVIRIKKTGQVCDGAHKKLISARLFKQVQDIKAGKAPKKSSKHNHTYRGLFQCGLCNSTLTGERQKGKIYYRCHVSGCASKTVREDLLDRAILNILRRIQLPPKDVEHIIARIKSLPLHDEANSLARAIKLQIEQLNSRIDRLTNAMLDDVLTKEEFQKRKADMLIEGNRLQEKLNQTEQKKLSAEMIDNFFERIKSVANTYCDAPKSEKRNILSWATSNRKIVGKSLCLEPSKWLLETEFALAGLCCGDAKATFRTQDAEKRLLEIILTDKSQEKQAL